MGCVEKTQSVAKAMKNKNWEEAVELRGRCFQGDLATYRMLTKDHPDQIKNGHTNGNHHPQEEGPSYNIAVMCVGTVPAPGMNAAVVRKQYLGYCLKTWLFSNQYNPRIFTKFKFCSAPLSEIVFSVAIQFMA